jgi:hypothetical protein
MIKFVCAAFAFLLAATGAANAQGQAAPVSDQEVSDVYI